MSESDAALLGAQIAAVAAVTAAIIAAGSAGWIGVLQLRALRQQNRIAIYEKRFEAFLAVQTALQNIGITGRPEIDDIFELNRALRLCWFIFPRSLSERLQAVRKQAVEMRVAYSEIWDDAGNAVGASNEQLERYHRAQLEVAKEWEELSETFYPHMRLDI